MKLAAVQQRVSGAIDWFGALRATVDHFYWSCPARGQRVLGLGVADELEVRGPRRFDDASQAVSRRMDSIELRGDAAPAAFGPLAVGGFEFAEGAPARFWLPEVLLVEHNGAIWLTQTLEAGRIASVDVDALFGTGADVTVEDASGFEREGARGMERGPEYRVQSDRSHADYCAQVDAARRAIAAGELEKVVLARSLRVRHDGRFDRAGLLRRLERTHPTCVTFVTARRGECLLGATPEQLVARSGTRVTTGAVAGSARRGRTPEEDERLGRELRECKKEQEEHAVVVREITSALRPVCKTLELPESPRLLRTEGIQHLETPIEGRLDESHEPPSVIDLAGRLHPTPAVGGAPREAALEWIAQHEGLDREGYAGPVGFVDRDGGGEFRVALRSGVVRSCGDNDEARLFAGAGIVADSDPARELEETRIKLRALLAPMTEI